MPPQILLHLKCYTELEHAKIYIILIFKLIIKSQGWLRGWLRSIHSRQLNCPDIPGEFPSTIPISAAQVTVKNDYDANVWP